MSLRHPPCVLWQALPSVLVIELGALASVARRNFHLCHTTYTMHEFLKDFARKAVDSLEETTDRFSMNMNMCVLFAGLFA